MVRTDPNRSRISFLSFISMLRDQQAAECPFPNLGHLSTFGSDLFPGISLWCGL